MDVTQDLYLSESQDSDSKRYVEIFENGKVSETLLMVPHPYFEKDATWFIDLTKQKRAELGRIWNFAIRSRARNDEIVAGMCVLEPDENGGAEVGYWLAEEYWGQGLMALIIKQVISYVKAQKEAGLGYSNITHLKADIFSHNKNSGKVLLKCGFTFVKHVPARYVKNGVTIDGDEYVLQL